MAIVTRQQIADLRRLIDDHMAAHALDLYGPAALDPGRLEELVRRGIIDTAAAGDLVGDAYLAGMVIARLEELGVDTAGMDAEAIARELERNPVALSPSSREAVDRAAAGAGMRCRHLGDRIGAAIEGLVVEHDDALAAQRRGEIADATAAAVAERRTASWLRGEIGRRIGMYEQDLDRIAATELQDAHNEGTAADISDRHGDDATVVKIPNPSACQDCRRLYLTDDGTPRVFTMDELRANGTNVGRKRPAWEPVVSTTHPWCACTLRRLPPGFEFDESGDLVPI